MDVQISTKLELDFLILMRTYMYTLRYCNSGGQPRIRSLALEQLYSVVHLGLELLWLPWSQGMTVCLADPPHLSQRRSVTGHLQPDAGASVPQDCTCMH